MLDEAPIWPAWADRLPKWPLAADVFADGVHRRSRHQALQYAGNGPHFRHRAFMRRTAATAMVIWATACERRAARLPVFLHQSPDGETGFEFDAFHGSVPQIDACRRTDGGDPVMAKAFHWRVASRDRFF